MYITKLVQDIRTKTVEIIGCQIYIIYDEPISAQEANYICEEYEELNATFVNDVTLVLEVCNED